MTLAWAVQPGAASWTAASPGSAQAAGFHRSLPGYHPSPLVQAPALAESLGVGSVWVKDESDRLGLSAFKILGASWAVNRALSARAGRPPCSTLDELTAVTDHRLTLVSATDGNHGRAVARMARLLGIAARIYVPQVIGAAAVENIAGEGAQVVRTDHVYDQVVRLAAASTRDRPGDVLVQDTAWTGYHEVPQWIVDGYGTLFEELDQQLHPHRPELVCVPTGVGSLLQSALQHYRHPESAARPAILAVEPVTAACVTRSLAAGRPVSVDTSAETTMAGLNCGTVSEIAWPTIRGGLTAGVGVDDSQAAAAARQLWESGVPAGPCGAAALAGASAALTDPNRRRLLGITAGSTVVLISTEGGDPR